MVFVHGLFENAINGKGVGKEVEGIGRGTIPAFSWRSTENHKEPQ
jgi:hypothetical protein